MFSACIIVGESVEGLGATLGALVPAIADGILRDAVIVDFSADPDVELICDAAGCTRIAARDGISLANAGAGLRGDWLLLMMAGSVPQPGWHWSASDFVQRATLSGSPGSVAAAFNYAYPGFARRDRIRELWRRLAGHVLGQVSPGQGLILHQSHRTNRRGLQIAANGWKKPPAGAHVTVLPVTMTVPA
ncbi:MAG: hypothetical protein R3D29_05580 [Nitratireductor sp.]